MNYKKTYRPTIGYTKLCEIGKCSLRQLEFGIIELQKGDMVALDTDEKEYAFIFLGGHASITVNDHILGKVGGRADVFGGKPWSVYAPRCSKVSVTGLDHVKIAVCATPTDSDGEAQVLPPEHVTSSVLGVKPWERDTYFVIDGRSNASRLCIGECFTTPGNWAGFPPHKHDVDNMPHEGVLEEIYYFLFQPEQGFAVQCLYTGDGEIDEAYRVKQDELVEMPRGYHTTVSAPGYNTYFLWIMAGEHQGFFRSNDPDHSWVSAVENMVRKNQ